MLRRRELTLAATLLGVLAAACTDQPPVAPSALAPPTSPVGGFSAAVTCEATVRTATLLCGPATPGETSGVGRNASSIDRDFVTLGRQGIYVQLTSSGTAYDGSGLFTSSVTMQNLLPQPMNTTSGTTVDTGGVKVFFNTGPSVTRGTGIVTVANRDGTATFTGADQPFFEYSTGVVFASEATSAAKTWQFTVPNTVTSFAFTVYVTTQVPAAGLIGLTWAVVSAGEFHTCGLTTTGAAYCWGYNVDGELGNGPTTDSPRPVAVSGGLTFATLSAGAFHTCGVTPAGTAYCWGVNASGELGNGATTNSPTPTPTAVSGELTFAAISASDITTCGLTTSGATYGWGSNEDYGLGNDSRPIVRYRLPYPGGSRSRPSVTAVRPAG